MMTLGTMPYLRQRYPFSQEKTSDAVLLTVPSLSWRSPVAFVTGYQQQSSVLEFNNFSYTACLNSSRINISYIIVE